MYELKVTKYFSAAHNLCEFYGKCENLHGHNWFVEARVRAGDLDKTGLAIDFGVIKKHLHDILEIIDHTYLNENPAFKGVNPSSENIAKWIFEQLAPHIEKETDKRAWLYSVSAWESDNASATYIKD